MFKDEKELRKTIRQDYESTGPEGDRSFRIAVDKPYYYSAAIDETLPPRTAATIYNGGDIPAKWKKAYGIKNPPRKRTNINLIDPQSAFETIKNNHYVTLEYIEALADELTNYLIFME